MHPHPANDSLWIPCASPRKTDNKLDLKLAVREHKTVWPKIRFERYRYWRPRYRQASHEDPKTGGFASPPFGGFALKQRPYYEMPRVSCKEVFYPISSSVS